MSSDSGSLSSSSRSASPTEQILADTAASNNQTTNSNTAPDVTCTGPPAASRGPGTSAVPIAIPDDEATTVTDPPASGSSSSITPARPAANGGSQDRGLTDGRVRNPVPSKLLNKTNKKDGNFSVMSMNVRKQPLMDERDLAAKRASEATQAAALRMSQDYAATKRRYNTPLPYNGPKITLPAQRRYNTERPYYGPEITPVSSQQTQVHQRDMPPPPQLPPPRQQEPGPTRPPTWTIPAKVKSEQARLLTFIRSLSPLMVVDQVCHALAYFGGTPEAPPPQDIHGFPPSAGGNGSGAQFVGWFSEIFPHNVRQPPVIDTGNMAAISAALSGSSLVGHTNGGAPPVTNTGNIAAVSGSSLVDHTNSDAPPSTNAGSSGQPQRRQRGRPKGSKGAKPRKDKGIKKGPKAPVPENANGPTMPSAPGTQADNGNTSTEAHAQTQQSQAQPTTQSAAEAQSAAVAPAASSDATEPDSSILSTPGSKRRGRPKGSKNRPRPALVAELPSPRANPDPQGSPTPNPRAHVHSIQLRYRPPHASSQGIQKTGSASEGILSQHAQNWIDPRPQNPQQPSQNNGQGSGDKTRKRTATQAIQNSSLASSQVPGQNSQVVDGAQAAAFKRRRTEQESRPASAMSNMDSQPSTAELSVSPALNPRMPNMTTTTSTSSSFSSNSSGSRPSMHSGSGQLEPQGQQHFQQQMRTTNPAQPQKNTAMPRKSLPGSYTEQQAAQQSGPQGSYPQQQVPNRQAHPGNKVNSFSSNPGLRNNTTNMTQIPNNHGQQFDEGLLNMHYARSARGAVQQQSNPATFGDQTQLGATLADPYMPYQGHLNQ